MKTIKSFSNLNGSIHLYEVTEGKQTHFINMFCQDGLEVPMIPTKDLMTASILFDFKVEVLLKQELN